MTGGERGGRDGMGRRHTGTKESRVFPLVQSPPRACQRPVAADGRNPRGTGRAGGRAAASRTPGSFSTWILLPLAHGGRWEGYEPRKQRPSPLPGSHLALPGPLPTSPPVSFRRWRCSSGTFPSPAPRGAWGAEGGENPRPRKEQRGEEEPELPVSVPNKHFWAGRAGR